MSKYDVDYGVGFASHCRALVQLLHLRSLCIRMFVPHSIGDECCDMVAESLHVWKIEHSPTPSLIPKPPRRCLKVWLCPPPGPLRHRSRRATAPHRATHPASLLSPSRGLPSGPQPTVCAGFPPSPFPAMPPVPLFSILVIATTVSGLPTRKGAGYTSP